MVYAQVPTAFDRDLFNIEARKDVEKAISLRFGAVADISPREPSQFDITIFRAHLLEEQNVYRRHHGVPALAEDPVLNEAAQKWTGESINMSFAFDGEKKTCVLSRRIFPRSNLLSNCFEHEKLKNPSSPTANPKPGEATGHFTQMIWRSSKSMGVGATFAKDRDDENYFEFSFCIKYAPTGNVKQSSQFQQGFVENVPKPIE